jgi:hypothetical protein
MAGILQISQFSILLHACVNDAEGLHVHDCI